MNTKRERIDGDYILEVGGDFTRKIHKSEQVKIGVKNVGNLEEEILGNHGYNISNSVSKVVSHQITVNYKVKILILNIGGKETTVGGGTYDICR